jgi:putative component of membrane protein insertase Oxa1/YidC/SpoIIIJ protein YidD
MAGKAKRGRRGIGLAVIVGLVVGTVALAEEPWSGDPEHPVFETAEVRKPQRVLTSNPFYFAFRVWAELLTKIDGRRCAHRPSCSRFAYQAIRRHKIPLGIWMALSRLMRGAESSAIRGLVPVAGAGGVYLIDRIEDYTFWW